MENRGSRTSDERRTIDVFNVIGFSEISEKSAHCDLIFWSQQRTETSKRRFRIYELDIRSCWGVDKTN